MKILSFNFFLYTISGMWRPIEWSSKCSKMLYSMLTCFTMYFLIIFTLTQLLDIILVIENVDDFAMNTSMLLSFMNVLFKAITVITHRDKIVNLIEILQKEPCKVYSEKEINIQMKFDCMIRSYSIKYTSMCLLSAIGGIIKGLHQILKGHLPIRMWVPYDYTSPFLLWFTSIQTFVALIFATIVTTATETTILGFCLQICAQIEILKYRLQRTVKSNEKETSKISLNDESNETYRLSECILHHLCIIRLAKMINKVFSQVIFVQFFASILLLGTSLYHLSSHMTITYIISMIMYVLCMFVQIFVYCWAGNEVILKSTGLSDAVYEMDWISMPINKQKDLLIIMKRSTRPIIFTSSFLVTLSLESYVNLLKASYAAFNFFGMWRPIEWSSKCSKMLYWMLTCFTMYLLIILMLTQLLDIILVIENVDDFATTSLLLLSTVSVLFKATAVITRRDEIVNLIETLQKKPCTVYNEEESDIQIKFDCLIRSYSIRYTSLASFSATGAVLGGMFNILEGELPYRMWVPYDYTSPLLFWFTSIQEVVAVIFGTIVNVATETTVLGFCLQICAQIEILKHRLQTMMKSNKKKEIPISLNNTSNGRSILSEHILHHLCIIRLAKIINKVFSQVIFVQFFASILVLCTSLYHLSSHMTITDIISLIIYVLCMFVQIFVYCWAGNEVILKSTGLSEAVYEMDWVLMPISEQKDLLMIMRCSTRPIKFTSSFLVTLSLESYGNLLKTSYSAFNLLQQS
ncbi:odorant receptor Or1-like [Camponotus floridanus]|uniref:odorant receptor Or1-like n=1 Tax=Camponotus floridanus TaxID=104421 RepID=UPI000DC6C472|nr:odorant receptor Or1-like [Camponotus floridanus]